MRRLMQCQGVASSLLLALGAAAREEPNNVIHVTAATAGNSTAPYACTALDAPYDCCTGANAGNCDQVLNGADLCVGLEQCEDAGGCRLQLPQGIFEEAEHRVTGTNYWGSGPTRPCGGTYGDEGGFPNGLIVQGKGKDHTILRADVPARATEDSQSIVTVALNGGLTHAEAPRIVYQDLTINGYSTHQPYGSWAQYGFSTFGRFALDWNTQEPFGVLILRRVKIHETVRHCAIAGAPVQQGGINIETAQTMFLESEFSNCGCLQPIEGAAGVSPCGCDAPTDPFGDCNGWNAREENCVGVDDPHDCCTAAGTGPTCPITIGNSVVTPGYTNESANLTFPLVSNTLVARNSFENGAHYATGGCNACGITALNVEQLGYDDFSPASLGTGWHIHQNRFKNAQSLDLHGQFSIALTDNIFEGDCFDDAFNIGQCTDITFANAFTRNLEMKGNHYLGNTSAIGITLNFWRPLPGEAGPAYHHPPITIEDETIELNCSRCTTENCRPFDIQPGYSERTIVPAPYGTYTGDLDDVQLNNIVFTDSVAGNDCAASLFASLYRRTGGAGNGMAWTNGLRANGGTWIAGGRNGGTDGWGYSGATRAIAYFNYVRNLAVENLTLVGSGADGRITFGRGSGQDQMAGSCYENLTLQAGASIVNPYPIASSCP